MRFCASNIFAFCFLETNSGFIRVFTLSNWTRIISPLSVGEVLCAGLMDSSCSYIYVYIYFAFVFVLIFLAGVWIIKFG